MSNKKSNTSNTSVSVTDGKNTYATYRAVLKLMGLENGANIGTFKCREVVEANIKYFNEKKTKVESKYNVELNDDATFCITANGEWIKTPAHWMEESEIQEVQEVQEVQEIQEVQEVKSTKKAKYKIGAYVPGCGKITEVFSESSPVQYKINREIYAEVVVDEAFAIFNDCVKENIRSDYTPEIIKKHWKLLEKSVFGADSKSIKKLLYKYQIEAARGTGGIGAGPGKIKEPRRGVQQLVNWARNFHICYEDKR